MPTSRARLLAAALAASAALALLAAPSADAGTYRAVQCHDGLSAGHADVAYTSTSDRYRDSTDCDGSGLGITHVAGNSPTRGGRFGAWTLAAPAGTQIVRASARVAADGQDWHAPQLAMTLADGARTAIGGVRGSLHTVSWMGEAGRSLSARLACTHPERCGAGADAFLRIRRISVLLRDAIVPTVTPTGSLLQPGSRRGTQTLTLAAADTGGGVRSVAIELNGDPLDSRSYDCRLSQGVAVRLSPCPAQPTARFDVVTTAGRFRQGPNQIRMCANDYAASTNANRACVTRAVRIDNRCPVAAVHGAELRARFAGGGEHARVRSDQATRVVGRVTRADGAPVAGAEVCVAARPLVPGSSEVVLVTPTTDADGTFAARIPAGPSREIRVAHWPGADHALERYLTISSRAVPELRLRPERTLRNGERVRFRVALPGPAAGDRRVEVQARADGRWLRIAGGRTDSAGAWNGSYRFNSTTGRRTYTFRAIVPRQQGYPYGAGASAPRKQTVVGRRAPGPSGSG